LLEHFGRGTNNEALAGDLLESFQEGRSRAWYWRQVLVAIRWRLLCLILSLPMTWYWASHRFPHSSPHWQFNTAAFILFFYLSFFIPYHLSGRQRAYVVLLMFVAGFALSAYQRTAYLDQFPFWLLLTNLLIYRKEVRPAYRMTLRELLSGDPAREKKRLIANLEQTMAEEKDPELRHAYAVAIDKLQSEDPTPPAVA
jgi:hypothetical protein